LLTHFSLLESWNIKVVHRIFRKVEHKGSRIDDALGIISTPHDLTQLVMSNDAINTGRPAPQPKS
jgi:hypothetical protein